MSAQTDFHLTLDRAARLIDEAACTCRAARAARLPHPHRQLVNAALRKLEWAQDDLFKARNDPWSPPSSQRPRQLALL